MPESIGTISLLPVLAVLIPALAALAAGVIGNRNEKLRNMIAVGATIVTLVIILMVVSSVFGGHVLKYDTGLLIPVEGISLNFEVDAMGAVFALISAVLWVAALLHAFSYIAHEEKRTRFFVFIMITEAATLGVFLVHDFFSLFVFFEIMGLAAYPLVIHTETEKARAAATKYLYMAVIGGLGLLLGIFLYLEYTGTISFIPPENTAWLESPLKVVALVSLIAGFGVKAGMVPLHVWLPDAHPAAPAPASALLSGVMIKAGAYGIIRTVASFFYRPAVNEAVAVESVVENNADLLSYDIRSLGCVIIGLALITMLTGVVLALVQNDIKRTLAYSSISQMGFILFGAGCFTYLGEEGGIGLAGSLFHVINHALFKGCLFLIAGSVMFRTHELNMFKLDSLRKKMPVSTLFWCIAALGIAGLPLFNGFASKTLLHHAVGEAAHLAAGSGLSEATFLHAAEILFIAASAGTVLYFCKMTYYVFFHPTGEKPIHGSVSVKEVPYPMLAGTGLLAIGIIGIGILPGLFLQYFLMPALGPFAGLNIIAVAHLSELSFFTLKNMTDAFLAFGLGIGLFGIALYTGFFERIERLRMAKRFTWPYFLSFNNCYIAGTKGIVGLCFLSQRIADGLQSAAVVSFQDIYLTFCFLKGNGIGVSRVESYPSSVSENHLPNASLLNTQKDLMTDEQSSINNKIQMCDQLLGFKTWQELDDAILSPETTRKFNESGLESGSARTVRAADFSPGEITGLSSPAFSRIRRNIIRLIIALFRIYLSIRNDVLGDQTLSGYCVALPSATTRQLAMTCRKLGISRDKFWDDISLGVLAIALLLAFFLLLRLFFLL